MATENNSIQTKTDVQMPDRPSLIGSFFAIKTLLVSISIVGLVLTNIATVVNSTAHDFLYRALSSALAIGGDALVAKALMNSPRAKTEQKIKTQAAQIEAKNKQLNDLDNDKKVLTKKLTSNRKLVKETTTKVTKRLGVSVLRNIKTLPSKAAPYLGAVVLVASTTADIHDACQIVKDMNQMLKAIEEDEEKNEICGQNVPSVDEVKASVKKVFEKKDGG